MELGMRLPADWVQTRGSRRAVGCRSGRIAVGCCRVGAAVLFLLLPGFAGHDEAAEGEGEGGEGAVQVWEDMDVAWQYRTRTGRTTAPQRCDSPLLHSAPSQPAATHPNPTHCPHPSMDRIPLTSAG